VPKHGLRQERGRVGAANVLPCSSSCVHVSRSVLRRTFPSPPAPAPTSPLDRSHAECQGASGLHPPPGSGQHHVVLEPLSPAARPAGILPSPRLPSTGREPGGIGERGSGERQPGRPRVLSIGERDAEGKAGRGKAGEQTGERRRTGATPCPRCSVCGDERNTGAAMLSSSIERDLKEKRGDRRGDRRRGEQKSKASKSVVGHQAQQLREESGGRYAGLIGA